MIGRARSASRRYLTAAASLALLVVLLPDAVATAQATRTLRIFPSPVVLAPGESVEVTAWFCRLPQAGDPFGPDGTPGTADDGCKDVKVAWAIEETGIARARPQNAATTRVTGRRDGLTTLTATYQATKTSSFATRVGVDVAEPLPSQDGTDAGDGTDQPAGPAVPAGLVVQPDFAIVASGDSRVFAAYECPILDGGDPRGPDGAAGSPDDFCRPVEVMWDALGGTIDPTEGYFTIYTADGEDEEDTAFVAFDGAGRRTAVSDDTTPGSSPTTGHVAASRNTHTATASVIIDPDAPSGPLGDANGDGVVDLTDAAFLLDFLFTGAGDPSYPSAGDLNDNTVVDPVDVSVELFLVGGIPPLAGPPGQG